VRSRRLRHEPRPRCQEGNKDEPIPAALRDYPDYYSKLFAPKTKHELNHFRTGQAFDKLVRGLGAEGYDGFQEGLPFLHHDAL
jgi:hypothetical protein